MWKAERTILHLDMDAYFASIEQQANPFLRGKPIIVTGEGRTVVTTASYEARRYGVQIAMTVPEARQLCPQVIIVHGNPPKYIDTTLRINHLLQDFTEQVEIYSIDEYFLDISKERRNITDLARDIKGRIKSAVGLACSVGIAPNKLMAKLASGLHKPDGLTVIPPEHVARILQDLPVQKLCGVGRNLGRYLDKLGIKTARDLGRASRDVLKGYFGIYGQRLKDMGQGIDPDPVKKSDVLDPDKSVGNSHTLPRDTFDLNLIKSYLMMLCVKVSTRLRQAELIGRTITLVLRFSDFKTYIKQKSLPHHIKLADDIYQTALFLLRTFLPLSKAVRMVGVSTANLTRDCGQKYLFSSITRKAKLNETIEQINDRYGAFTLRPALVLLAENFGMEQRCALIGKYLVKKHA